MRDVLTVGVSDASVRLVQPLTATVIVEIEPAPVERQLTNVPVRWRNLGADLRAQVSPSVVRVGVRGAQDPLSALPCRRRRAFVDLAGLGAGRYNLRVQVDPAESFGVTSIEPGGRSRDDQIGGSVTTSVTSHSCRIFLALMAYEGRRGTTRSITRRWRGWGRPSFEPCARPAGRRTASVHSDF